MVSGLSKEIYILLFDVFKGQYTSVQFGLQFEL